MLARRTARENPRTEREGSQAESVERDRRWHFLKEDADGENGAGEDLIDYADGDDDDEL